MCVFFLLVSIVTKPPPLDTSETATEFSLTHFSRDSDLISLEIKPHRYVPGRKLLCGSHIKLFKYFFIYLFIFACFFCCCFFCFVF